MKKLIFIIFLLLIPNLSYADSLHKKVGVLVDFGVPSGINVGLSYKPLNWATAHLTASHNLMAFGVRGGLIIDPLDHVISPIVSVETGGYWRGNLSFIKNTPEISYVYVNLHFGINIGNKNKWNFFILGGPSYISATVYSLEQIIKIDSSIRISSLNVSGFVFPSAKLGINLFF